MPPKQWISRQPAAHMATGDAGRCAFDDYVANLRKAVNLPADA